MLDIREMLRRFQAGDGDRRIARDLGASRKTVSKYRSWATAEGLDREPLPEPAQAPLPIEHRNLRGAAYYGAPEEVPC